jgi:hypothetical protein
MATLSARDIRCLISSFNEIHFKDFHVFVKFADFGEGVDTLDKLIEAGLRSLPTGVAQAFVEHVKSKQHEGATTDSAAARNPAPTSSAAPTPAARGPPAGASHAAQRPTAPPTAAAVDSAAWDVAIAVVAGSETEHYLDDAKHKVSFLLAVGAHVRALNMTQLPDTVRPRVEENASPLYYRLSLQFANGVDCWQLFVRMPAALTQSKKPYEQADTNYALFCGGTDIFGPWAVRPLGKHVLEVVIHPASDAASPKLHVTSVSVADARTTRSSVNREGAAELRSLECFVSYYTERLEAEADSEGKARPPRVPPSAPLDRARTGRALDDVASSLNCHALIDKMRGTFDKLGQSATDPPRGLMLWGPPGTGKTTIAERLITSCGFAHVVPQGEAVAAGELKGMLEGQTEKNIKALLTRSLACPWLMFGLVVDEVESLVPNRMQRHNSDGGGGSSGLGVVLTWFGGTKVKNLFIFAATNIRSRVDEAFARRLTDKLFVGLPSSTMRRSWTARLRNGASDETLILPADVRDFMTSNSVNYSGANMKKLFEDLQARAGTHRGGDDVYVATKEDIRLYTRGVAESERVLFAGQSQSQLADTCDDVSDMWKWFEEDFGCIGSVLKRLIRDRTATGRVLVNLAPLHVVASAEHPDPIWEYYAPYVDVQLRGSRLHSLRPQLSGRGISQSYCVAENHFILQLLRAATELDVSCARLIDNAMFGDRGCDDEASMLTILREEASQASEYDRALLILDLDAAFIDVNFESNLAHESIHRKELFGEMLHIAKRKPFVAGSDKFLLVVLISSYEPLVARATHELSWPANDTRKTELAKRQFDDAPQRCDVCHFDFFPRKNEDSLECKPHSDATLVCVAEKPEATMPPTATMGLLTSMIPWQANMYQWRCCKQPWGASQCTLPGKQHKSSAKATIEQIGRPCTKRHAPVEASLAASRAVTGGEQLSRVWCNFCSCRVAAPQSDEAAALCRRQI